MLHNISLHIFFHDLDKLPSTVAATGVENQWSTAELENPEENTEFCKKLIFLETGTSLRHNSTNN